MVPSVVNVVMLTYNHEDYIEMAIESVLSQKTNFTFNLILGEDCSSDSTYSICLEYSRKYPETILLLPNDKNLGLINNYKRCFDQCTGEYVAILEGDDYWTDEYKLQKQYNLFLSDMKIGLVHTNYQIYDEYNKVLKAAPTNLVSRSRSLQGYGLYENVLKHNFICAITTMFKADVLREIDLDYYSKNNINTVDFILWLTISQKHKIVYLDEITSVYRVSFKSISNSTDFKKIEAFTKTKSFIASDFLSRNPIANYPVKRSQNYYDSFLFLKAVKTRDLRLCLKYLRKVSLSGLIDCYEAWKIHK